MLSPEPPVHVNPRTAVWPDTSVQDPPVGNQDAAAAWLLGRHPQLSVLAGRVPGVVSVGVDGLPEIDLDALADALGAVETDRAAWAEYEVTHPAPGDDDEYDAWAAAGPKPHPGARSIGVMSRTEGSRLRLLAVFSSQRVPLGIWDTQGLDDARRQLLSDWCRALLAA
jgi:hypothetical protein